MKSTANTQQQTTFFFPFYFCAAEKNLEKRWTNISDVAAERLLSIDSLTEKYESKFVKKDSRDPREAADFNEAERRCRERLSREPLWVKDTHASISADLHSYIRENYFGIKGRQLADESYSSTKAHFSPEHTEDDASPFLVSFGINKKSEDVFGKVSSAVPDERTHASLFDSLFTISLPPAAQRRSDIEAVRYSLHDARVHLFQTGIGFLALTVSFILENDSSLDAQIRVVQEGNYALSHPQYARNGSDASSTDGEFRALARGLIQSLSAAPASGDIRWDAWTRIYSYTALVIENPDAWPNLLMRDMTRLARHYTSDYQVAELDNHKDSLFCYRPFDNQLHLACIEGGVSLICCDGKTEHQRNWMSTSFKPLYLPIVLLDLHNYTAMLGLIQKRRITFDVKEEKGSEALAELLAKLSEFRLNYLFHEASQISLHNDFHRMLDDAFRINAMCERLALIVSDAREFLEIAREQTKERQTRWLTIGSSALGGGFLGREIAEVVKEKFVMNTYEWQYLLTVKKETRQEVIEPILYKAELSEWGVLVAFAIGALSAAFLAKRFGLKGKHH